MRELNNRRSPTPDSLELWNVRVLRYGTSLVIINDSFDFWEAFIPVDKYKLAKTALMGP
jgi:hypothetical protein